MMKKTLACVVGALLCVSTASLAVAEEAKSPPSPSPRGGMDGMGMMGGMSEEMQEQHLKQKQESLLKMHEYMHRIMDAKDEKERERLKAEQLKLMREQMNEQHQMMRQMMQHRKGMAGGQMLHGQQPMGQGGQMRHGAPAGDAPEQVPASE